MNVPQWAMALCPACSRAAFITVLIFRREAMERRDTWWLDSKTAEVAGLT